MMRDAKKNKAENPPSCYKPCPNEIYRSFFKFD
jgi:hypothetical protein